VNGKRKEEVTISKDQAPSFDWRDVVDQRRVRERRERREKLLSATTIQRKKRRKKPPFIMPN